MVNEKPFKKKNKFKIAIESPRPEKITDSRKNIESLQILGICNVCPVLTKGKREQPQRSLTYFLPSSNQIRFREQELLSGTTFIFKKLSINVKREVSFYNVGKRNNNNYSVRQ